MPRFQIHRFGGFAAATAGDPVRRVRSLGWTLVLSGCVSSAPDSEQDSDSNEPDAAITSSMQTFEGAEVGPLQNGWNDEGWNLGGYGDRALSIDEEIVARGARALRIEVTSGQGPVVAMLTRGSVGELSEAHYGRVFLRIAGPGPAEFVHFDVFEGGGSWEGQDNRVRWAATGTGAGPDAANWAWIYNVQRTDGGEFGTERTRAAHPRVDDWMCIEWRLDAGAQEALFWLDGASVDYLGLSASDGDRTEIPSFRSLSVGFQKFQRTQGFVVWIDEIAFALERIGCE